MAAVLLCDEWAGFDPMRSPLELYTALKRDVPTTTDFDLAEFVAIQQLHEMGLRFGVLRASRNQFRPNSDENELYTNIRQVLRARGAGETFENWECDWVLKIKSDCTLTPTGDESHVVRRSHFHTGEVVAVEVWAPGGSAKSLETKKAVKKWRQLQVGMLTAGVLCPDATVKGGVMADGPRASAAVDSLTSIGRLPPLVQAQYAAGDIFVLPFKASFDEISEGGSSSTASLSTAAPVDVSTSLPEARALLSTPGRTETLEAIRILKRLLYEHLDEDTRYRITMNLALGYYKLRQYQKSFRRANDAVALVPGTAKGWLRRSEAARECGWKSLAARDAARAQELGDETFAAEADAHAEESDDVKLASSYLRQRGYRLASRYEETFEEEEEVVQSLAVAEAGGPD